LADGGSHGFFQNIGEKKAVTFFRPLSWKYTAACCPLNAACRSLNPRDSSFGAIVFGILCRRADLHAPTFFLLRQSNCPSASALSG
jgi:hypothetical protein